MNTSQDFDILPPNFFNRPADKVARDLLGKKLVRVFGDGNIKEFIITETESYLGEKDKACHAHKGKTKRTEVMYGPPGFWYVYLVYGMHHMLNIVCQDVGEPHAVLIRSVKGIEGPGRLTKKLKINMSFNKKESSFESGLFIADNPKFEITKSQIEITPRIGIGYAQECKDKPLRFVLKDI